MIISLFLGLILGAVSIIFILQNTTVITINFLNYHLASSLALVILGSMLMGLLIALVFSIPEVIRNHMRFRNLRKQNKDLETSLADVKSKVKTSEIHREVINEHLNNTPQ